MSFEMATIHITECDQCKKRINIGEKYYQVMERIKGEYPVGMQTYCCECINSKTFK